MNLFFLDNKISITWNHLNCFIDLVEIGRRSAFEMPIEKEISIVGNTWTRFRDSHSQFQFTAEAFFNLRFDGNVCHWRNFDRNLLVGECQVFRVFCVVGYDDEILGA